jgi:hypothetical protein
LARGRWLNQIRCVKRPSAQIPDGPIGESIRDAATDAVTRWVTDLSRRTMKMKKQAARPRFLAHYRPARVNTRVLGCSAQPASLHPLLTQKRPTRKGVARTRARSGSVVVAPSADFEFSARAQVGAARALVVASLQTLLTNVSDGLPLDVVTDDMRRRRRLVEPGKRLRGRVGLIVVLGVGEGGELVYVIRKPGCFARHESCCAGSLTLKPSSMTCPPTGGGFEGLPGWSGMDSNSRFRLFSAK